MGGGGDLGPILSFPHTLPALLSANQSGSDSPKWARWLLLVTKQAKLVVHFFCRFSEEGAEKRSGAE